MALKPVDLETTITLVHYGDPAFDEEKSDLEGYLEAHYTEPERWADFLKPKDGEKPTLFIMGVITPSILTRIEDDADIGNPMREPRYNSLNWEAFKYALRDIKNGPTAETTDPNTKRKKREVPKVERNGVEYVDPRWLEQVCVGKMKAAADFVGGIAYRWQRTLEPDRKNS